LYDRHRTAGHSLDGCHDFKDRVATARSEIQSQRFRAVIEVAKRGYVSPCKIGHVDEVAFAGTVGCRIICAENLQRWTTSGRGVNRKRYEMSFRIVPLAKLSLRICSTGVEVAQKRNAQIMCTCGVLEDLLAY
jgi:hypothetical protein